MRAVLLRYAAVIGIGLAVLAGILYYATSVDGRPPFVEEIRLTLHATDDEQLAFATSGLEVAFSEPVRIETAEAAFRIQPDVAGEFSWSGATLRFTPEQRLPLEAEFVVHLEAGVEDEAGNRMADPSEPFEFRTVGPPVVIATQPADGATAVPLDTTVTIDFNTLMDTASVEAALFVDPAFGFEPLWSAERLTLVPTGQLSEGLTYRVRIGTDARDSAGIPLPEAFTFSFETTDAPLEATQLVPADGIEGVAVAGPIAVIFDRALDSDQDLGEAFAIDPSVAGDLEVMAPTGAAGLTDPSPRVLRFAPSAPLAANTTYRVSVAPGIVAADGSQLGEALSWTFTTGAPFASLANQVVFLSDRGGVTNLWAMNPDGSGQRQISAELSPVTDYAVAPDGRRVVLGDGAVLVLQSADGGSRALLTAAEDLEFDPAWAPDGTRLAFGRADPATGSGAGLWTRDVDGGDEARLELTDAGPDATPLQSGGVQPILRAPRWSPDGTAIAFVDGSGGVAILDVEEERELRSVRTVAAGPPSWLADSSAIIVTSLPGGDPPSLAAGEPLPPLLPEEPYLSAAEIARLELLHVPRSGSRLVVLGLPPGAHQPVASAQRLLFVLDGRVHLADVPISPDGGPQPIRDGPDDVRSATFGVEGRTIVLARANAGIWSYDTLTGDVLRLSGDGWRPRWLP